MNSQLKRHMTAFAVLFAFLVVHFCDRADWMEVPLPDVASILGGQAAWVCPALGVLFGVELLFGQVWAAASTVISAAAAGCI